MNLVKSTGNGMSLQVANIEGRKQAIQRKGAEDAYRKQAEYYIPIWAGASELEELVLDPQEKEAETLGMGAAFREFQQLEHANNMAQVSSDFSASNVLELDWKSIQKKRLKEQAIAKYSYQIQLKNYGFIDQQSRFSRTA